jgi:hypothetical protein
MSESNRDLRYIEALIDGMGAEFQKGFRQWLASQPSIAECLPLTRAEDLAFQPSLMTGAERAHVAGCRYCRRLVARFEAAGHPSTAQSMAAVLNAAPEDTAAVERHAAACASCAALRGSPLWNRVLNFCRQAAQPIQELSELAASLVAGTMPLAARAESFGAEPEESGAPLRQGGLTIGIASAGADLVVTAAFDHPAAGYNSVAVWLRGESGTQEIEIGLQPSGGMLAGGARLPNVWSREFDPVTLQVTALPWRSPSGGGTE